MTLSVLQLALWTLASLRFSTAQVAYVPKTNQQCPETLLRQPPASKQTLNPNEVAYLADRRKLLPEAWRDWIGDGCNLGYDLDKLGITANDGSGIPIIGVAMSGGGHRAAQVGAGILSALDIRNQTAKAKGTGGLLQVSSYLSGNSGGSWLVSSMLFQNFPDMFDLVLGNTDNGGEINGWFLEKDVTLPGGPDPNDPKNQLYLGNVFKSVVAKARAGFDVSITDLWSVGLAHHFLTGHGDSRAVDTITTTDNFFTNETSHGTGILWSDMTDLPVFQNHQIPLPIVVVDSLPVAKLPPNTPLFLNSTVYEFTPWEFGSYDPNLSAFVDVRFMGTRLLDGRPADSSCVTAFDQASFIFGTSSSLFNLPPASPSGNTPQGDGSLVQVLIAQLLAQVSTRAVDVGNCPNPFMGINPGVYQDFNSASLSLVDGGQTNEVMPLAPLLVKARNLDVIVAIDGSSDDSDDWPEAVSLYVARDRAQQVTSSVVQQFPPIPANQADINRLGLNRRATFFGCDPKESPAEFPLLIYIPNAPPVDGSDPVTNTDTDKTQYQPLHTNLILNQAQVTGFSGFVEGQLGADPDYGRCLQCAAVDRARLKTCPVTPRSDVCSQCFKKYCFDPEYPPPEGQIVGRKIQFKDPNPVV